MHTLHQGLLARANNVKHVTPPLLHQLMAVTYRNLDGEVVIIDLDDEDGFILDPPVAVPDRQAPAVTFDEALAAVLQLLPDIDPKV